MTHDKLNEIEDLMVWRVAEYEISLLFMDDVPRVPEFVGRLVEKLHMHVPQYFSPCVTNQLLPSRCECRETLGDTVEDIPYSVACLPGKLAQR